MQDLYAAHADLLLVGHEHSYERFRAAGPRREVDPEHGIREIVVGTGGRSHDPLGFAMDNSEVRNMDTFGVIKVTLMPHGYTWEFVPVEGSDVYRLGVRGLPQSRAAGSERADSVARRSAKGVEKFRAFAWLRRKSYFAQLPPALAASISFCTAPVGSNSSCALGS